MKRLFALLPLMAFAAVCSAQLEMNVTWTTPSAAPTVTVSSQTGQQVTGPLISNVYRAAATITAGVASCPAFSASTWNLLTGAAGIPGTSSGANANTFLDTGSVVPLVVGNTYCYAVTSQFQSGGSASGAGQSPAVLLLLFGSPSAPTNLTAVPQAGQ
jgi:hypothetical protein